MNESAVCPQCSGHATLKQFRVHRKTGAILNGKKAIWGAIALSVLSCVIINLMSMLGAKTEGIVLTVVGAYLAVGGIIASIVIAVRYIRAPKADWLECTSCGHRWKAEAQEMKRMREEAVLQAGSVVIPFDTLAPGVYAETDLGLKPLETCVYCGQPATKPIPQAFVHQIKDAEGKKVEAAWTLKFDLPYCEKHARISRRNSAIYSAGFWIGLMLGVALVFLWFAADPEQALRSILKPLSYVLPQAWMALITMVALLFLFVAMVGGFVALIVRSAGSLILPSMRDQPLALDGALGISGLMDGEKRTLMLRFTREQTAIDYQALNREALQGYTSASEQKQQAEAGAEAARLQAAAEASRPAEVVAAAEVQAEMASQAAVCWYCEKDRPADGTPHNVVLSKKEGEERREETVWVPRCTTCEGVHRFKLPTAIVAVMTLATMAPCIVIGVLFGAHNKLSGWAWVIGTVVSFVAMIGMVMLYAVRERRRAAAQGTRQAAVANALHPEVQALLAQGWQVETTKSGSALGKA